MSDSGNAPAAFIEKMLSAELSPQWTVTVNGAVAPDAVNVPRATEAEVPAVPVWLEGRRHDDSGFPAAQPGRPRAVLKRANIRARRR